MVDTPHDPFGRDMKKLQGMHKQINDFVCQELGFKSKLRSDEVLACAAYLVGQIIAQISPKVMSNDQIKKLVDINMQNGINDMCNFMEEQMQRRGGRPLI